MARKRDVSWGSANIIRILESMNIRYSCSWKTGADNTPNAKTNKGQEKQVVAPKKSLP